MNIHEPEKAERDVMKRAEAGVSRIYMTLIRQINHRGEIRGRGVDRGRGMNRPRAELHKITPVDHSSYLQLCPDSENSSTCECAHKCVHVNVGDV